MKISREVKAAILVISGLILFFYLMSYLKGDDLFDNSDVYYTNFNYNALSKSSPVTVKGNSIGKIEAIEYDFETGKTRVSFTVNPKLQFSKNSKIRLYATGLMGGNGLAIIDANDGVIAKPGDVLQSEVKKGLMSTLEEDFSGVSKDLDQTIRSADTLMNNLNAMVVDDSQLGVKSTIAELNETLKAYKNLSYSIQGVIKSNDKKVNAILTNFEKTSKDLSDLTQKLNESDIKGTVENLNSTLTSLQSVVTAINNNKGTLGKLLNDDKLYNNFEAASKELEMLLKDIKLHPARYRRILSKKEIPYKAPEN